MLGKTGMHVSPAGFGTGGSSQFGQRKGLERQRQTALIRRCLDLGVNLFDTHEGYGSSERILGEALRGVSRGSYYLVTKWAYHRNGGVGQNAVALTASVERSLTRRGVERIDVMMLHGILAAEYDVVVERFMPTLERLQEQGKIGFKGVSELTTSQTRRKRRFRWRCELIPRCEGCHHVKVRHPKPDSRQWSAAPRPGAQHWGAEHGVRAH